MKIVFSILQKSQAEINFKKSAFCSKEIVYLGHVISGEGIRPDTNRIDKFKIPTIKNKRDLQKLLGLLNWFRPFIPNFSKKLNDIYDRLKKGKDKHPSDKEREIVSRIIQEIKKGTLLHFPKTGSPYELFTDASEKALGAVLIQDKKIIGFYSYRLNGSEVNYTVVEKETLAILKSLSFFKNIIFNERITCFTDNSNLLSETEITKRINRWKILLAEYDIEIKHTSGAANGAADYLSRLNAMIKKEIDEENPLSELLKKYQIKSEKVYFNSSKEEKEFLKSSHLQLIHPGVNKHFKTIQNLVNIKKLKYKIAGINSSCITCNRNKHYKRKYVKTIGKYEAEKPFQKIAIDIKGPIPSHKFDTDLHTRSFFILVILDVYSRFVSTFFLKSIKTSDIIKGIKKAWLTKYELPMEILKDQERQFISTDFANFTDEYGIKHLYTTAHNPHSATDWWREPIRQ